MISAMMVQYTVMIAKMVFQIGTIHTQPLR
jgi:hypothetical protein